MSSRDMMANDRASAAMGMVVELDEPGRSVVAMRVRDDMTNGFGITHGGLVFALADTAFAIACNEDDRVTVAVGAEIDFVRSSVSGELLRATAERRVRQGRRGVYDVTVADEAGEVVALFRGRAVVTDRPAPPSIDPADAAAGGAGE
jgi:acyl-CoA thioesterase